MSVVRVYVGALFWTQRDFNLPPARSKFFPRPQAGEMKANVGTAALLLSACLCGARMLDASSTRTRAQSPILQLRGGQSADDEAVRAECIKKLNSFPMFCVVNSENNVVGLPNDKGGYDVTWYVDLEEAREILNVMIASSDVEDPGFKLSCTPLGNAFMICAGLTEHKSEEHGPQYLLKPARSVLTAEVEATLRAQLQQRGLADENTGWLLPVFLHDEFQTDALMPIFFSAAGFTQGWINAGRPVDEVPQQPLMMDIRMLMLAMQQDSAMSSKAQPVPSREAYQAAKELQV